MPLHAQKSGDAVTSLVSPLSLVTAGGMQGAESVCPCIMAPRSPESQRKPMAEGAGMQARAAWQGFEWA